MENGYDQKIIEMLRKTKTPMDIEKIRVEVKIGNWNTALNHCLALLISQKISGVKTSKSWVFWAQEKAEKADAAKVLQAQTAPALDHPKICPSDDELDNEISSLFAAEEINSIAKPMGVYAIFNRLKVSKNDFQNPYLIKV